MNKSGRFSAAETAFVVDWMRGVRSRKVKAGQVYIYNAPSGDAQFLMGIKRRRSRGETVVKYVILAIKDSAGNVISGSSYQRAVSMTDMGTSSTIRSQQYLVAELEKLDPSSKYDVTDWRTIDRHGKFLLIRIDGRLFLYDYRNPTDHTLKEYLNLSEVPPADETLCIREVTTGNPNTVAEARACIFSTKVNADGVILRDTAISPYDGDRTKYTLTQQDMHTAQWQPSSIGFCLPFRLGRLIEERTHLDRAFAYCGVTDKATKLRARQYELKYLEYKKAADKVKRILIDPKDKLSALNINADHACLDGDMLLVRGKVWDAADEIPTMVYDSGKQWCAIARKSEAL